MSAGAEFTEYVLHLAENVVDLGPELEGESELSDEFIEDAVKAYREFLESTITAIKEYREFGE